MGTTGDPGASTKNSGDESRLLVIPGRERKRANPESRCELRPFVWIPDRRYAASGMTIDGLFEN
jgi:hypothetical protein